MIKEAVSCLSLRGSQTPNLGRVSAVVSLLQCSAVVVSLNYGSTPVYKDVISRRVAPVRNEQEIHFTSLTCCEL